MSLLAALMCVALMFAMEWLYALITVCFLGVLAVYILWRCVSIRRILSNYIFFYKKSCDIRRRNPEANWGSSTQGQVFVDAVKQAQVLTNTPDHVKNYRPKVLVEICPPENTSFIAQCDDY